MKTTLRLGLFILGIAMAFVLWLNYCYSFCSDDCIYALCGNGISDASPLDKLNTFEHAWKATLADGYRPVVHFFVRIFTGVCEKWVFNIANTFVWGMLIALIIRIAKSEWKGDFESVVLCIGLVYCVLCKGESYLWCAGSINYLWTGAATLFMLIVLENIQRHERVSWSYVFGMSVLMLFIGWMQEAFSLPVLCGLLFTGLIDRKSVTIKKVAMYVAYAVGSLLLVLVASRRMHGGEMFNIPSLVKNAVMVLAAIKAVWLVVFLLIFRRDRSRIVHDNMFEFAVVIASVCMILIVGFNGERSLWMANLAAIVVLVREISLSRRAAVILSIIVLMIFCAVALLGFRIRQNFDVLVDMYTKSQDGVAIHERVNCGPFGRFFYQHVYTWQTGLHPVTFSHFHGKKVLPFALSKKMYSELYLKDTCCVNSNKLSISGDYYTSTDLNAIIHPLVAGEEWMSNATVAVSYRAPINFMDRIKREWMQRNPPPVDNPMHPMVMYTSHGNYLLLSKLSRCDSLITDVKISKK